MSWTDEEIDKLAQESAANSSFEYKNEYWTEFEAMLSKKRKGDSIIWFFSAFLFVGLIGTSLIFNETFKNSTTLSKVNQNNVTSITLAKTTNENSSNQKSENNNFESQQNQKNNGAIQAKSNVASSKNVNNTIDKKYYSKTASQTNKITIDPSILAVALGSTFEREVENETKQEEFSKDLKPINNLDEQDLNDEIAPEYEVENEDFVSKLPLLALKTQETTSPEIMPMASLHNERELPAKASFYVIALGGVSQSLITPSNNISNSFGLGLGAQIQKGRFTFTTGLNGIWSNHKDLKLTRSAKVYGFGSNQYNYEFNYRQIYTLEAELTAGYKFGRHLINVGVRPSYIVGTKVGITESIDEKSNIERNEYGHVNGLNRFGIKPMLGYSFDITNSLKVGLNVGVEMMPKIQEGFLVGSNNRFPIDGQIYLRHSLKFRR